METKFMHVDVDGGKVTFAFREEGQRVLAAPAFCAPGDQFSRKLGRTIAEGRLDAKGQHLMVFPSVMLQHGSMAEALVGVLRGRARRSAYRDGDRLPRWLNMVAR